MRPQFETFAASPNSDLYFKVLQRKNWCQNEGILTQLRNVIQAGHFKKKNSQLHFSLGFNTFISTPISKNF